jgi:hypothetical protein
VDDQPPIKGKAPGLITKQPRESLCVGFDSGAPVGKYKHNAKDPYQGTISDLKVVIAPPGERR